MAGLERALPAWHYLTPEAFALERERVLSGSGSAPARRRPGGAAAAPTIEPNHLV